MVESLVRARFYRVKIYAVESAGEIWASEKCDWKHLRYTGSLRATQFSKYTFKVMNKKKYDK